MYILCIIPIIVTIDLEKEWPQSDWPRDNSVVVTVPEGAKFFCTGESSTAAMAVLFDSLFPPFSSAAYIQHLGPPPPPYNGN